MTTIQFLEDEFIKIKTDKMKKQPKKKPINFPTTVTAKVTEAQKQLFLKSGGSKLVRQMLDKIKDKNDI